MSTRPTDTRTEKSAAPLPSDVVALSKAVLAASDALDIDMRDGEATYRFTHSGSIHPEESRMNRRKRIEQALTEHLRRVDTNNGKHYCVDCDANERKDGSIMHGSNCVVTVALAAYDGPDREKETQERPTPTVSKSTCSSCQTVVKLEIGDFQRAISDQRDDVTAYFCPTCGREQWVDISLIPKNLHHHLPR